jgi:formate/nitrite transporter FocA (FNT family)
MEDREDDHQDHKEPSLPGNEVREVERRRAPRAVVIHEAIRHEGELELKRSSSALAWSGMAAGLSMGFSMVAEGLLMHHLPEAGWTPLVVKLGYSIGFLIVILGRQQLFTENTLTPILPFLHRRGWKVFWNLLRLWLVVLVTNLGGALLFAWGAFHGGIFSPGLQKAFLRLGEETMVHGFWQGLVSALYAGWLIALIIWLLPFAETARVTIIILITYLIGLGEFGHIIAGSVKAFYLVIAGTVSWGAYLSDFFLPTLLGNMIGGIALVAAINHAQVFAGGDPDQ